MSGLKRAIAAILLCLAVAGCSQSAAEEPPAKLTAEQLRVFEVEAEKLWAEALEIRDAWWWEFANALVDAMPSHAPEQALANASPELRKRLRPGIVETRFRLSSIAERMANLPAGDALMTVHDWYWSATVYCRKGMDAWLEWADAGGGSLADRARNTMGQGIDAIENARLLMRKLKEEVVP